MRLTFVDINSLLFLFLLAIIPRRRNRLLSALFWFVLLANVGIRYFQIQKNHQQEQTTTKLEGLIREPRYLNYDVAKKILENSPRGLAEIRYVEGNQDAFQLAFELYGLLRAYGWSVSQPIAGTALLPTTGVCLEVGSDNVNEDQLPPSVAALYEMLMKSFEGLGDAITLRANQELPKGTVAIIIGPKY